MKLNPDPDPVDPETFMLVWTILLAACLLVWIVAIKAIVGSFE